MKRNFDFICVMLLPSCHTLNLKGFQDTFIPDSFELCDMKLSADKGLL